MKAPWSGQTVGRVVRALAGALSILGAVTVGLFVYLLIAHVRDLKSGVLLAGLAVIVFLGVLLFSFVFVHGKAPESWLSWYPKRSTGKDPSAEP